MKIEWKYDLCEKPFCEQLKLMGWQWLEGHTDVPYLTGRNNIQQPSTTGLIAKCFFASNRLGFSLGIAGDQRTAAVGSGFGAAKNANPFVDLFFEFVFVDEAVDPHGAEEVGSLQIPACAERGRTKRIPP